MRESFLQSKVFALRGFVADAFNVVTGRKSFGALLEEDERRLLEMTVPRIDRFQPRP